MLAEGDNTPIDGGSFKHTAFKCSSPAGHWKTTDGGCWYSSWSAKEIVWGALRAVKIEPRPILAWTISSFSGKGCITGFKRQTIRTEKQSIKQKSKQLEQKSRELEEKNKELEKELKRRTKELQTEVDEIQEIVSPRKAQKTAWLLSHGRLIHSLTPIPGILVHTWMCLLVIEFLVTSEYARGGAVRLTETFAVQFEHSWACEKTNFESHTRKTQYWV